ncbi:glycosyl hydrolase 115 family protein [Catenovulum sediminis]|uniref:glycosyl hydrolase 115 family protein n=1 Tax=Catenovulum sediminis TaxID=1740262 RepID=UPI00163D8A07|nr:glycosyl hydrolase 115 family protein [Catenovulum sediminis]
MKIQKVVKILSKRLTSKLVIIAIFFCLSGCNLQGQSENIDSVDSKKMTEKVKVTHSTDGFVVASASHQPTIYISAASDPLILWAVETFVQDVHELSGQSLSVKPVTAYQAGAGIYIGQISDDLFDGSALLPTEVRKKLIGQWENFSIMRQQNQLVVSGSDVRGTVYAIFELAERLGVSPWKWWADVHNRRQDKLVLHLPESGIYAAPSVEYRGIFLNDEDWGLQPWAAKTFEPDVHDIGPKTYEKIFQLMLRLKANTIWPAMHDTTQAFFTVPGNQEMASKYHIYVGSSHAEPMLRNNVGEWDKSTMGEYNYLTNAPQIKRYWLNRVKEVQDSNNKSIFTLGMRGVHDSKMQGVKSVGEGIRLLDSIISEQRKMLDQQISAPLAEIPQVFIPYKEVLELYNNGLQIPDDVTLVWTDDNYGYIRRLSNEMEQQRAGGSGVYYHISYWGRPHDYLWLSTTSPALIWYEMNKAYQNGAQKIWIVNVGDIKPAEYQTEFFLDLAWNINIVDASSISSHLTAWAQREFGQLIGGEVSEVMLQHYHLAHKRKPEFMGWSQTEPTTQTQLTAFSKEQIEQRINAYQRLVEEVERLSTKIASTHRDAWFQLIEYPIKGAALMNFKFLYRDLFAYAKNADDKARFKLLSTEAYRQIEILTEHYNRKTSQGKWQHMMSMAPRNLPAFKAPDFNVPQKLQTLDCNIENIWVINASDFANQQSAKDYRWKLIEGLGNAKQAVTLFPFTQQYFHESKPNLTYRLNVENAGQYIVELRTLPTHANKFDHQVTLYLDDQKISEVNLNTKGRTQAWKQGVLSNALVRHFDITIDKPNLSHELKFAVNQTGIVFDQVMIYPATDKSCY